MSPVKFLFSLFVLLALLLNTAMPQTKRTNTWHFPNAGFDFNYGSLPTAIPRLTIYDEGASCSISDTNGNFLFSSNGERVLNKNGDYMEGGDFGGYYTGYFQGPMAFPIPGNERFYYLFTFKFNGGLNYRYKLLYSVIDMQANNGLGKVCDSMKMVPLKDSLTWGITAIHRPNSPDVWLVVHGAGNNKIYSFLVTPQGINPPVVSMAGDNCHGLDGRIKLSPCGDRFVKKTSIENNYALHSKLQVLSFDNQSGIATEADMFEIPLRFPSGYPDRGFEFSPDCSKFYLSDYHVLYQYDLNAGTPDQILASRYSYELDTTLNPYPWGYVQGDLLLGPDGKVYSNPGDGNGIVGLCGGSYLSVINSPNLYGEASDFHQNELMMADGDISGFSRGLPNFMVDWLKDPTIKADTYCSNAPVTFSLELNGSIDSVFWDFNDFWNTPNDTSTAFSPSYTFSHPGTYNISAVIHFGNLQKTIPHTIVIRQSPKPDIGPADTLMCLGGELTLDAGTGYTQYRWNNGLPGGQTYAVTSEGLYFVKVRDQFNCYGSDTIQVNYSPTPEITTIPSIKDANCNNANGAITGIVISGTEPLNYEWKDASGNLLSSGSNLTGVPAGSYLLTVTDGAGCEHTFPAFQVNDLGATPIQDVLPENDHCNLSIGTITIIPESGNPDDFEYSINGGQTYLTNGGVFENLPEGPYNIMIRDLNDCVDSWDETVTLINQPGPVITGVNITPEVEGGGDGIISLIVEGTGLTFTIDNGASQTEPVFSGLSQGEHTILITDEFGCQSDTTVIVDNLVGVYLRAIADDDRKCLHKIADSRISLSNVTGLANLKATLHYNSEILNCIGFKDKMDGLDAIDYPALSCIVLEWHGNPITNADTLKLIQLVFETTESGIADISWDQAPTNTSFTTQTGDTLKPVFKTGSIQVHDPPVLSALTVPPVCTGDELYITPEMSGGTDPFEYTWHQPDGDSVSMQEFEIHQASETDAGDYFLTISDNFNCADTVPFRVIVIPPPAAGFETTNDTIYYEHEYRLEATQGYASYEWSTGDTIYFINVSKEGEYEVIMQTKEGCTATESVMMLESFVDIKVPSAFTPNGDGLNDVFQPVVDTERVRRFRMTIYNQWGQRLFETISAHDSWGGNDLTPGVYIWVLNYENRIKQTYQLKGSVTVIK